jgi:hypothetical protein
MGDPPAALDAIAKPVSDGAVAQNWAQSPIAEKTTAANCARSLPPAPSNHHGPLNLIDQGILRSVSESGGGRTARHEPLSLQIPISFHGYLLY